MPQSKPWAHHHVFPGGAPRPPQQGSLLARLGLHQPNPQAQGDAQFRQQQAGLAIQQVEAAMRRQEMRTAQHILNTAIGGKGPRR